MKLNFTHFLLFTLIVPTPTARSLPSSHPPVTAEILKQFSHNFDCPYAEEWISKGAERFMRDYENLSNRRLRGGKGYGPPPSGDVNCAIAPGPMGGGHQAGYSNGYLATGCKDTPSEDSPYMWPLRWTAIQESKSMENESDRIKYYQLGRTYYRLDKNWKRGDTYYREGISTHPVDPERKTGEPSMKHRTVLHRGTKMVFLEWNDTRTVDSPYNKDDINDIVSCSWMDLGVIGNLRPDFFMDDRGDSTDVQYLGNQHIYHPRSGYNDTKHEGGPRLVKQWRKMDFANQYFVMSMLANPEPLDGLDENGEVVHWPTMFNIPGEGFADDNLRYYSRHMSLPDNKETDDLFMLDEQFALKGGECLKQDSSGGSPPRPSERVPSNLEIDQNSWRSILYTFSPKWPVTNNNTTVSELTADEPVNKKHKTQLDHELQESPKN